MKKFSEILSESLGSPKDAEKAERGVVVMLSELPNYDNSDSIKNIYEDLAEQGKMDFMKKSHVPQVIGMVEQVIKETGTRTFKDVAQTDNNVFSDELSKYNFSGEGTKKADILFKAGGKKYRVSIKLDGAFVIASASSPKTFLKIFENGVKAYEKNESDTKDLDKFKENLKIISKDIIGKMLNRIDKNFKGGNSEAEVMKKIQKKIDKQKKIKDKKGLFKTLKAAYMSVIDAQMEESKKIEEGGYNEYYDWMKGDMRDKAKTEINTMFNTNKTLRNYIVFEAMTGKYTFDDSDASANYILTPKKMIEVKTPHDDIVKKVAKNLNVDFRGLPDKTGSFKRLMKVAQGKAAAKNYFDMKLNVKMDIRINEEKEKILDECNEIYNKNILLEGIFDKFKNKFKIIIKAIAKKIRKGVKNLHKRTKEQLINLNNSFMLNVNKMTSFEQIFKLFFNNLNQIEGSIKYVF